MARDQDIAHRSQPKTGQQRERSRRRKALAEIKLTPEGWVFLIVLGFITVGAVLRNVNLLIVMAGMMYAPLLLNWRYGIRRLKSLRARRRLPSQLHAKELANIQWTCENRLSGFAAWNVIIYDRIERAPESQQTLAQTDSALPQKGENWFNRTFGEILNRIRRKPKTYSFSGAKLAFVRINAGQSEVQAYRAYFGQRGKYLIGPAAMSTTFPFGLLVSRTHFPTTQTVFVAPETGKLEPTWERRIQSTAIGSDAIKRRRALEEDEFYALRPWRSGDNKKNIHWRTTARFGQPIVKQYDQQNNRDFALMLDLFANEPDDDLLAQDCEKALSFATTVVLQISKAVQGQVAVGICGRETHTFHSRSPLGVVSSVMRSLAVAQPTPTPELEETLLGLFSYVSNGTPIYVISSRPKPEILNTDAPSDLRGKSSGDRKTDRISRTMSHVLPMIRWITVGSEEYQRMFSTGQDTVANTNLTRLSSKWTANAKR